MIEIICFLNPTEITKLKYYSGINVHSTSRVLKVLYSIWATYICILKALLKTFLYYHIQPVLLGKKKGCPVLGNICQGWRLLYFYWYTLFIFSPCKQLSLLLLFLCLSLLRRQQWTWQCAPILSWCILRTA